MKGLMQSEPVSCLATSRLQADRAVNHLLNTGLSREGISILLACTPGFDFPEFSDSDGPEHLAPTKWEVGGAIGWLPDLGYFSLPGAGRFMAAGPLSAALGGPTAALTVRVVAGALRHLGIPTAEAWQYVESVTGGQILVSFGAEDSEEA